MTLMFSRSLYDPDALRETVAAYGELATWTITVDDHTIAVVCTDPSPEIPDLTDHFANHALHLSIANARRSSEGNL
ncbi:MAG: hypothetical protein CL927_17340 [Deltaproteobacteria bacterium]|nr:hypothetical protein [Deltaproteobacteria bacterium]HCH65835.1 hypothetical protein [Deltaproteobacteria bacterium]|tara:strand:- start:662 stop:889 length:228 start_codon:yes stop_codon:yes gene_type:complete